MIDVESADQCENRNSVTEVYNRMMNAVEV